MSDQEHIENVASPVFGLVLSGGQSTRMGRDKGAITYHDKPQRDYLYEMLEPLCQQTFLSIRSQQMTEIHASRKTIMDTDRYKGPFNGIMSAHVQFPDVAWLVLACDLPLINTETIRRLLEARDPGKAATTLATKETGLPEPLAAIWESKGLREAARYLGQAQSSCPRKFLLNSEIELVFAEHDELLWNANSEEDYQAVLQRL